VSDRIVQGVNVDREWRLFGEVVPTTTAHQRCGHRTAYFWRKQAINWARHALRRDLLTPSQCKDLALSYLARYREALTRRAVV